MAWRMSGSLLVEGDGGPPRLPRSLATKSQTSRFLPTFLAGDPGKA